MLSVLSPVFTSFVTNREAIQARKAAYEKEIRDRDEQQRKDETTARETRNRVRMEFLRQSLTALIVARERVAKAAIPTSRVDAIEMEMWGAISTARGIIFSVADDELIQLASIMGNYKYYNDKSRDVASILELLDKATIRLGFLIAQYIGSEKEV